MGYTVRVRLLPNTYVVRRDGIEYPSPHAGDPAAAIFRSNTPPKDSTRTIVIVGVVDRVNRELVPQMVGVEGQVVVRDCTITVDEQ